MTGKELQEFWEWCGFKLVMAVDKETLWSMRLWINPLTNKGGSYPDLDLNNLFKYAVPEFIKEYSELVVSKTMEDWLQAVIHDNAEPTPALYQAIQKARKV